MFAEERILDTEDDVWVVIQACVRGSGNGSTLGNVVVVDNEVDCGGKEKQNCAGVIEGLTVHVRV